MSKYLAKNLNFFMLLLVFVIILTSVGVGVYYVLSYARITDQYQQKATELTQITQELASTKDNLNYYSSKFNETSDELNAIKVDLDKYDSLYMNVTGELDKTRTELTGEIKDLEDNLDDTIEELDAKKAEIVILNKQLVNTEENLTRYRGWYLEQLNETQQWKIKYEDLENDYEDLMDECNATG